MMIQFPHRRVGLDPPFVRVVPERGIQVNQRDLADEAEAPRERTRIARIQRPPAAGSQG
jgi:hypothetical protein